MAAGIGTLRDKAAEYFGKSCESSCRASRGFVDDIMSADALSPKSGDKLHSLSNQCYAHP